MERLGCAQAGMEAEVADDVHVVFDCVSTGVARARFACVFEGVEPGDLIALMSCGRNEPAWRYRS